jgi:hypothetical protein
VNSVPFFEESYSSPAITNAKLSTPVLLEVTVKLANLTASGRVIVHSATTTSSEPAAASRFPSLVLAILMFPPLNACATHLSATPASPSTVILVHVFFSVAFKSEVSAI